MNDIKTSGYLATVHNRDPQTIRNWCEAFGDFLSEDARGGNGKTRKFSLDDQFVIATIAELTDQGQPHEFIQQQLTGGYRVETIPTYTDEEMKARSTLSIVPADEYIRQLDRANELARDLQRISSERDEALASFKEAQELITQLKHEKGQLEGQLKEIDSAALHEEIKSLNREIGRLEAQIEMLKNED